MQIYEKNAHHIFRKAPGHFVHDTPANRKLITDMVSNSKNYVGKDKFGNNWYVRTQPNGKQIWASSRNGQVRNAGINDKPRNFNFKNE